MFVVLLTISTYGSAHAFFRANVMQHDDIRAQGGAQKSQITNKLGKCSHFLSL